MTDAKIEQKDRDAGLQLRQDAWEGYWAACPKECDASIPPDINKHMQDAEVEILAQAIANARRKGADENRLKTAELLEDIKTNVREHSRRAGLEEAARYHDEQSDEWDALRDPEGGGACAEYAKQHRADARAIRALGAKQ